MDLNKAYSVLVLAIACIKFLYSFIRLFLSPHHVPIPRPLVRGKGGTEMKKTPPVLQLTHVPDASIWWARQVDRGVP